MAPRNDYQIRRMIRSKLREDVLEIVGIDILGLWEALAIGIALAVVNYNDIEARHTSSAIHVYRNVSGAEEIRGLHRKNRFDVDLESPTADQPSVVLGIMVQIEAERPWLLFFHHFARGLPNFGLDASSTNRSNNAAIIPNQHLGRFKGRNRSTRADYCGERAVPASTPKFDDLFKNIHCLGESFHHENTEPRRNANMGYSLRATVSGPDTHANLLPAESRFAVVLRASVYPWWTGLCLF